jgi:hypothetical protein
VTDGRLLLDEPVLVVQRSLVRRLEGDHAAALLLQQIHYAARSGEPFEGQRWAVRTHAEWAADLCVSVSTLKRAVGRLRDAGLVVAVKPGGYDRRCWLRVDYDALHSTESDNALGQNERIDEVRMSECTSLVEREEKPSAHRTKADRDRLWDAVVATCGVGEAVTKSQRADIGKTVSELAAVGATPEQVGAAKRVWARKYPNAAFTHRVLRTHWAALTPQQLPTTNNVDGWAAYQAAEKERIV